MDFIYLKMSENVILEVEELSIATRSQKPNIQLVNAISFQLFENEILGIVGESGSGKSITSLAIMGLLPKQALCISSGHINYKSNILTDFSDVDYRAIRGKKISMIFQEPMSSLNPSLKCGSQVVEILLQHTQMTKREAKEETIALFEKVQLPRPNEIFNSYPHQISGGQKQRVMIAMAIACKPDILIADEPTTALDVTVQNEIISLLKNLQQETKMSVIFITHDLGLVSEIADRILVKYQGDIVEQGDAQALFKNPQNAYTKALLASRPSLDRRLSKLPTIQDVLNNTVSHKVITAGQRQRRHEDMYSQEPILAVKNVHKEYVSNPGLFKKSTAVKAVNDVSFKIYPGETLGLVGESGCGKSTLGNAILQLDKATSGSIFYQGIDITKLRGNELRALRKDIQIIFQDPYASLNPRLTVGKAIIEPMKVHQLYNNDIERKQQTIELLKRVGLDENCFDRYPHEFSGGQRQRIGIARTIALQPKLIVCDESVSALDISVQAQVLNLLNELKNNFGFSYIFISHDLSVVKYMSDQLLVMNQGKIEELGDADLIYSNPTSNYTKELISAIPKGL